MNSRMVWLTYSLLRIAFFAVPFGVLYAIGWKWWLALATATLISVALSVLLLHKQRSAASSSIYSWRMRDRTEDDIVEDGEVDAAEATSAGATSAEAPKQ